MSREKILSAVLNNQPEGKILPADLSFEPVDQATVIGKFVEVIQLIGGSVIQISELNAIDEYVKTNYKSTDEIISLIPGLTNFTTFSGLEDPHQFENTQFAVFEPHFAVAENGAVWLTEDRMGHRVLPFICQHLAMLVKKETIVANMHEAYRIIGESEYGFGTFIAGPSKTADIEQSLVLGAHGARSMTIFLI